MTLPKLIRYFGVALILYALISGIRFYFKVDNGGSNSEYSYSLKFGLLICGMAIIYLSKRLSK